MRLKGVGQGQIDLVSRQLQRTQGLKLDLSTSQLDTYLTSPSRHGRLNQLEKVEAGPILQAIDLLCGPAQIDRKVTAVSRLGPCPQLGHDLLNGLLSHSRRFDAQVMGLFSLRQRGSELRPQQVNPKQSVYTPSIFPSPPLGSGYTRRVKSEQRSRREKFKFL